MVIGRSGEREGSVGTYMGSGVGGEVGIGMTGRGGGERGQTGGVGWEGERMGIDRRSGVGGGESGDRVEKWGGRGREWR